MDLPDKGTEPGSPALQADSLPTEPLGKPLGGVETHLTTSIFWSPPLGAFLVAQTVKNLPAMQETQVQSLGPEDSLEGRMATHSNIPAWRIPWTEKPHRLQSMGSHRVNHD